MEKNMLILRQEKIRNPWTIGLLFSYSPETFKSGKHSNNKVSFLFLVLSGYAFRFCGCLHTLSSSFKGTLPDFQNSLLPGPVGCVWLVISHSKMDEIALIYSCEFAIRKQRKSLPHPEINLWPYSLGLETLLCWEEHLKCRFQPWLLSSREWDSMLGLPARCVPSIPTVIMLPQYQDFSFSGSLQDRQVASRRPQLRWSQARVSTTTCGTRHILWLGTWIWTRATEIGGCFVSRSIEATFRMFYHLPLLKPPKSALRSLHLFQGRNSSQSSFLSCITQGHFHYLHQRSHTVTGWEAMP